MPIVKAWVVVRNFLNSGDMTELINWINSEEMPEGSNW